MDEEWENDDLIKAKLEAKAQNNHETFTGKLMNGFVSLEKITPWYERNLRKLIATRKSRFTALGVVFGVFLFSVSLLATGIVVTEFFPVSDENSVNISIEAPIGTNINVVNAIVSEVEAKLLTYPEIVSFATVVGGQSGSMLSSGSAQSSHLAQITINLKDKEERDLKSYEL
ncbi:MAG: efflux RND transporter permease subunit, partial [Candidatus Magasanikbacteria bacterium]|nr:efflux RND transporter permease subunit [Candidatus Magasanikbacteria bacterium]